MNLLDIYVTHDPDTHGIIRFIVLLGVVWLVIGLLHLLPLPQLGKTILLIVGALVSVLLILSYFGLL